MDPNNPGGLMLLDWGGWEEFAGVVFGSLLALSIPFLNPELSKSRRV